MHLSPRKPTREGATLLGIQGVLNADSVLVGVFTSGRVCRPA